MLWGLISALIVSVGGNVVLSLVVLRLICETEKNRDSVAEGKARSEKPKNTRRFRVISPYIEDKNKAK